MKRQIAVLLLTASLEAAPLESQAAPACPVIAPLAGFSAGFGRRDITPPPAAGLLGYGPPQGRIAQGFRQRLKVRAMALQDARGERLVLAVTDLDFISGGLHRKVAAKVRACLPIDADRILLSATHTHSGPGQYTGISSNDKFGSAIPGFDVALQAFLVDRISQAIIEAASRQRPARAAWGQAPLWGVSRLRSWLAHNADPHGLPSPFEPPPELRDTPRGAVDPTLTVFRVDTAAGNRFSPAGAWALFAVHGTAIPAANDLYDSDVQGVATRVLEYGIDAIRGIPTGFEPETVGILANGAEGNTIPDTRPMQRECVPPVLRREQRPGSWRSPPGADVWLDKPEFNARACLEAGIADTREVGEKLGQAALTLFAGLGDSLRGDLQLSRHFTMIPLRGPNRPEGLCDRGRSGMAQFAGAETRETPFVDFRWFGIITSGVEQGGDAIRPNKGCWSPKRTPPQVLEQNFLSEHGYSEAAQFMVFRIGNTVIGSVPFEPTTTVGDRMRQAIRASVAGPGAPDRVVLVGLGNDYISYVTTRLEYGQQFYEGGATLYGPASAEVYTAELARVARELAAAGWRSPAIELDSFPVYPGVQAKIVRFGEGSRPPYAPELKGVAVAPNGAVLRWEDDMAGWVIPMRSVVVVVEREQGGTWVPVARDGTLDIAVRVLKNGKRRADYEARWTGSLVPGTRYRFRLPDPSDLSAGVTMEFSGNAGGTGR